MEDNRSNTDPLFWLPSDFLTDDDDNNKQLPTEFPYDFTHDNDLYTELTRQFSNSTLLDSNKLHYTSQVTPKSILSPVLSSKGSSPTALFGQNDQESWNLIRAAAGEVNMWKKMRNQTAFKNRALLPTPHHYFTPSISSNKYTHVKQNNGSIWGNASGGSGVYGCGFNENVRCRRGHCSLESDWPILQARKQHFNVNGPVSGPSLGISGGRRNVAGGGVGVKKKCAGTGVFLPRTCSDPVDSRVKPGCQASFTPPSAAAQALNVNYNNNVLTQAQAQPIFMGGATSDHGTMLMRRNAVLAQQWRNGMNKMGNGARNGEMLLPLEWSYLSNHDLNLDGRVIL